MEKRRRNNIVFTIVLLLLAGLLAVLPLLLEKQQAEAKAPADVISATAHRADIVTTLSGTGVLVAQDAVDVQLPDQVEITRYAVENGSIVREGQALVYVDRTSVLQAMSACRDTLTYIESEMAAVSSVTEAGTVNAPAKGVIKAIYAQPGDAVRDVMLSHGALALLEIDGEEWRAQAYTGVVTYVYEKEGSTVTADTPLFYLDDTADHSSFDLYAEQHREYETLMQSLAEMYKTGVISSPCDGAVSGIDEEAASRLKAAWEEKYGKAEVLSASSGSAPQLQLLASHVPPSGGEEDDGSSYTGTVVVITAITPTTRYNPQNYTVGISDFSDLSGLNLSDDSFSGAEADMPYFEKRYSLIQGVWKDIRDEAYAVGQVYLNVTCNETGDSFSVLVGTVQSATPGGGNSSGDGNTPGGGQGSGNLPSSGGNSSGGRSSMSADSGGSSFTGGASAGMTGQSSTENFEMYSPDGTVCMSVTPQETLSISITVDELDVLSVQEGAEAKLTIDALPGRSYTGTVSSLGRTASNSGGNSKYTAEIIFPRDDTMLAGMNASSLITVSSAEGVLVLPVAALSESGQNTFVYTSYDAKSGALGGVKPVETGVSDGENVAILSGLEEGETVYYNYTDEIRLEDLRKMASGGRS